MLSHAGAARFAFNAGLAHVKAGIEAGEKLDLVILCTGPLVEREQGRARRGRGRCAVVA